MLLWLANSPRPDLTLSYPQDLCAGLEEEKKSTSDLIIRLFPSLSTSSKDATVLEKEAKKLVENLTEEGESHEKLESQVGPREMLVEVFISHLMI